MPGLDDRIEVGPAASSKSGLDFVYGLLAGASPEEQSLQWLIAWLARAFGTAAAGLVGPLDEENAPACRMQTNGQPLPPIRWLGEERRELVARVRHAPTAVPVTGAGMGSCLLTAVSSPDGSCWLLWLEEPGEVVWDPAEMATLTLAGLALMRWASSPRGCPLWARPMGRASSQRRLDDAARVARRLAHDYGNILTGILGFSELALNEAAAGSPSSRFLQEVYRAAQQGAELTRLLQMFGCRRPVVFRPASVPAAATAAADRLRAGLRAGVELQLAVPPDLPPVAVNDEMLRVVLDQLLNNAREALAGPGVIRLSARTECLGEAECAELLGDAEPGPCVEVRVADTGSGVDPEVARRLVTEFFFSTKPRHRGLGLAVVYSILAAHRGGFRHEPAPGGGTVACLFLPLAVAPALPAASQAPGMGGEKVLVVDDEPGVLHMVGATLASAGYRVQTADSAARALDCYATAGRDPFQLVLSDILMPQLSGIDLARQLRRRDPSANVLFMSGQMPAGLSEEHDALPPFDLLSKPFQPETLLHAVRAALEREVPAGDGGSREEAAVPPSS